IGGDGRAADQDDQKYAVHGFSSLGEQNGTPPAVSSAPPGDGREELPPPGRPGRRAGGRGGESFLVRGLSGMSGAGASSLPRLCSYFNHPHHSASRPPTRMTAARDMSSSTKPASRTPGTRGAVQSQPA